MPSKSLEKLARRTGGGKVADRQWKTNEPKDHGACLQVRRLEKWPTAPKTSAGSTLDTKTLQRRFARGHLGSSSVERAGSVLSA